MEKFIELRCTDRIPGKLQTALSRIETRLRETPPGHVLRCPNYHFFAYRGYECGMVRCDSTNQNWVAFVRVPVDAEGSRKLEWPLHLAGKKRPFVAGEDFAIVDVEWQSVLVGFHSRHLIFQSDMIGAQRQHMNVDYIAVQLREYIDTCMNGVEDDENEVVREESELMSILSLGGENDEQMVMDTPPSVVYRLRQATHSPSPPPALTKKAPKKRKRAPKPLKVTKAIEVSPLEKTWSDITKDVKSRQYTHVPPDRTVFIQSGRVLWKFVANAHIPPDDSEPIEPLDGEEDARVRDEYRCFGKGKGVAAVKRKNTAVANISSFL